MLHSGYSFDHRVLLPAVLMPRQCCFGQVSSILLLPGICAVLFANLKVSSDCCDGSLGPLQAAGLLLRALSPPLSPSSSSMLAMS